MEKIDLLKAVNFGSRVAEQETTLSEYFVETEQWRKIKNDVIDIVYGPKGSGKSALFSLLLAEKSNFLSRGICIVPAENIRGEPIFKSLTNDPAPSEFHLLVLWKLYILGLIAEYLRSSGIRSDEANSLIMAMESCGLLPKIFDIETLLRSVKSYLKKLVDNGSGSEKTFKIDLNQETMLPEAVSITWNSEKQKSDDLSKIPVTGLLKVASRALELANIKLWVILDRLDVAFSDTKNLEKSALRALFRTYNDLGNFKNISLKIFVRNDLMDRINEDGFREASHIIRTANIEWDRNEILHLVVKRFVKNNEILNYFNVSPNEILPSISKQEDFIEQIFPEQIDTGKNPKTFDWILSRLQDGNHITTPREVIHMLECITTNQINRLGRGETKGNKTPIYDRNVFKPALAEVSKTKFENTLCAEYPEYKTFMEKMRGGKAEYHTQNLAQIWSTEKADAEDIAEKLHKIGFFEKKTSKKHGQTFWIPFIYRDALSIVKGIYKSPVQNTHKNINRKPKEDSTDQKFSYEIAIRSALEINNQYGNNFISGAEITRIINTSKINNGEIKHATNVSRALRSQKFKNITWIERFTKDDLTLFRLNVTSI